MLRVRVMILMMFCFLRGECCAGEWVKAILTGGKGDLEINTNYIVMVVGKEYDAVIPKYIKSNSVIPIKYKKGNKWVGAKFNVDSIEADKDLCRLYSELPSAYSSSIGDMIYVKPCVWKR